ncbi:hypothetical protein D3C75_638280 [compost metagenome]
MIGIECSQRLQRHLGPVRHGRIIRRSQADSLIIVRSQILGAAQIGNVVAHLQEGYIAFHVCQLLFGLRHLSLIAADELLRSLFLAQDLAERCNQGRPVTPYIGCCFIDHNGGCNLLQLFRYLCVHGAACDDQIRPVSQQRLQINGGILADNHQLADPVYIGLVRIRSQRRGIFRERQREAGRRQIEQQERIDVTPVDYSNPFRLRVNSNASVSRFDCPREGRCFSSSSFLLGRSR